MKEEKQIAPRFTNKLGINKYCTIGFNIIYGSFICYELALPASMRHSNAKVHRKSHFHFVKMSTYKITTAPGEMVKSLHSVILMVTPVQTEIPINLPLCSPPLRMSTNSVPQQRQQCQFQTNRVKIHWDLNITWAERSN